MATVGTFSGPVGGTFVPVLQGVQLWVKFIQGKGGLSGHPVKLVVFDDAADPARHRAQVQEAVEHQGAIAFLNNAEPFTGRQSVEYLVQKRVPAIGSETGSPWFYESPMHFPQASSGDAINRAVIASAASQFVPKGKQKLGSLACSEAQVCRDAERVWSEVAPGLGFDYVYKGRASIVQPDFTAECLAARNAGVDALLIYMDLNSLTRISNSCARQRFRPGYGFPHPTVVEAQKDNPEFAGAAVASPIFPFIQKDTPATQEFHEARRVYGSGLPVGMAVPLGWVSGKLLERAAANLSEPPTSADLLRGLWSLRNDTLGDLTLPLTFEENQRAEPKTCWWNLTLRDTAWVSPDRFARHCL